MFKELNTLRLFFEEPTREFHLRELARLMKKNPVTVKKYLSEFVEIGIISRRKERGLEIYSSCQENKRYKEYKRMHNKLNIQESGLVDFLAEKLNMPIIIVFGSYERGEDNKNSDIDIFILTEIKMQLNLGRYDKILNRRIQLHIMNQKEFNEAKKKNPGLINNIINGTILSGFIEVLNA